MLTRRKTKEICIGNLKIGANHPIAIQSMLNVSSKDKGGILRQASRLVDAGCDVVRLAVPDLEAVSVFSDLRREVNVPLVADVHFDYRIAIAAIEAGAHKIRINPGNIGSKEKVAALVRIARERGVPIRIGVNAGSLESDLLRKYGSPTPEALVESALGHVRILEELDFFDTVVSIKASNVTNTIIANRMLSARVDYPIHIGITEAGGNRDSLIKSSVGIGALLAQGIGDTVRVSLTDDPVREVELARDILSTLQLCERRSLSIVACPTCGRTKVDLISFVRAFEERAVREGVMDKPITVALMGCAVNGPGEAREADIGIAFGNGEGLLFCRGEIVGKAQIDHLADALFDAIHKM